MTTRAHLLVAACAVLISLPSALVSQTDTTASLSGKATSAFNGRPLANVMISVPAARKFVVTDSTGSFWLPGLPTGRQKVRISYQGRDTEEYEFALRGGRTQKLTVILDVEAVDLAAIVVEARQPYGGRSLAGFYDRKKWYSGFANFFTREDIERIRPMVVSDLLKRLVIWVRCDPECAPTRMQHGHLCAIPVSVDGMPFWDFDFDNISVADVAGVEVYRDGAIGSPFGFEMRSMTMARDMRTYEPFQYRGSCGSIQIWTR